jgi:hypothetical protein
MTTVLIFAALAALSTLAVVGIVLMPAPRAGVPWENVAWGKFVVAIVYASIAFVCFLAMFHTPDAARLAHAVRAAL